MLFLLLFGLRPYILESSSMEPTMTKGSLCLVNVKVDPEDLNVGDVVVYRLDRTLVMHRLVGDGLLQGDANAEPQQVTLDHTNFIGREVASYPGLGNIIIALLQHRAILFIFIVLFIILGCLPCRKPT